MYCQVENTIQTTEDMLRAYTIYFKRNWDKQMSFVDFAYNNSKHAFIFMAPDKVLYGRRCISPI